VVLEEQLVVLEEQLVVTEEQLVATGRLIALHLKSPPIQLAQS